MTILLNSAFASTFILLAAWLANLALRRRSADLRHRVWLAAILATAILPVLITIMPSVPAANIVAASTIGGGSARAVNAVRAFPWTFAIWLAGAAIVSLRLIVGIARISMITRRAMRRDGIYYSNEVSTPLTWGSAIILPEWNEIALRHETAHIERRDWIWQTFASLVTAVFWFQPLIWIARAAMRREAEQAVDDRVLQSGVDAREYASQLVCMARTVLQPAPAMSIAMVRTAELEHRVRAILDSTKTRREAGRWARAAIALGTLAVVVPLAAFQDRTVHKIGENGVAPPKVLTKVEPMYTQQAKDDQIEGTTALRCTIGEDGRATDFEVVRSLDAGLDAAAIEAVSQWEFAPGTKDGQPVAVAATIEINWRLK
jgi:TonB family protein